MDVERKISELLEICNKLDLDLRAEPLGGSGGGLCRIKGKSVIFIDLDVDPECRYSSLLASLANIDSIDDIYILPEIRSDLEQIRKKTIESKENRF